MTLEIIDVMKSGDDFVICPVRNHPLPPISAKSPEEVAKKLADHFEEAIREGKKSWITPATVLLVQMPGGKAMEISVEPPPSLNA